MLHNKAVGCETIVVSIMINARFLKRLSNGKVNSIAKCSKWSKQQLLNKHCYIKL
jgi:hypothetical protein